MAQVYALGVLHLWWGFTPRAPHGSVALTHSRSVGFDIGAHAVKLGMCLAVALQLGGAPAPRGGWAADGAPLPRGALASLVGNVLLALLTVAAPPFRRRWLARVYTLLHAAAAWAAASVRRPPLPLCVPSPSPVSQNCCLLERRRPGVGANRFLRRVVLATRSPSS